MTLAVFGVSLLAWALLALGLPRHHADWFGAAPTLARRRLLRALGWLGLPAGLALSLAAHGVELGLVLWAVALMLAAMAWSLLMAVRGGFSAAGARRPGAGGARRNPAARPRS